MNNPLDFRPKMPGANMETSRKRAVFDEDGSHWAKVQEGLVAQYPHIIVLRGAGTNNGIDKASANALVKQMTERIQKMIDDGEPVALMFDGDGDDQNKPDVGFLMGRLRDAFSSQSEDKIRFVTAQVESWMPARAEGETEYANLTNANGLEYDTTVFPGGKFTGDHNSFTQSSVLANASGFEEWFAGASGPIASQQLEDLNTKVQEGEIRKVVMFRAPINEELEATFKQKLADAEDIEDETKRTAAITKFKGVIAQRENRYGVHFDNEGNLTIDKTKYDKLSFEVV